MATLIEDIEAARELVSGHKDSEGDSQTAYAVRRRLKKTAFVDLRSAFLHFGDQLTVQFLRSDKEIDEFAAQWKEMPTAGANVKVSPMRSLRRELDSIELRAKSLRDDATDEMKRCTALLAETESVSTV